MLTLIIIGVIGWAAIVFLDKEKEETARHAETNSKSYGEIIYIDLEKGSFMLSHGVRVDGNATLFHHPETPNLFTWFSEGEIRFHHLQDEVKLTVWMTQRNGQPKYYVKNMSVNGEDYTYPQGRFSSYCKRLEQLKKSGRIKGELGTHVTRSLVSLMAFNAIIKEYANFDDLLRAKSSHQRELLLKYDAYIAQAVDKISKEQKASKDEREQESRKKSEQKHENRNEERKDDSKKQSSSGYTGSNYDIYLKVLEFDSVHNVTFDEIKKRYRALARKYHPDSPTGDERRFKLVRESYEHLEANFPR